MNKIKVLQIGEKDWNDLYIIPDNVMLTHYAPLEETEYARLYDLVIIDSYINPKAVSYLMKCTRAYCLFATENAKIERHAKKLFDSKCGQYLYTKDVEAFLAEEAENYYEVPYGEKLQPKFFAVNQGFKGAISYSGNYDISLSGDFGFEFTQVANWKNNIPLYENQCLDLYFEHEKSRGVDLKLIIYQFVAGSLFEIQQKWEFSGEELKKPIRIENRMGYGPLSISVYAKGKGDLKIISLHDRHSRKSCGYFIPGGERYVTSKGEEIFCYFDPADGKSPLAVYFSGYRTQEGFEGYYMMRSMGCPFLLITDPRLEGGAFYLGDDEYERLIVDIIKSYMKKANVTSNEVIMSGSSMGTFGALYYACDINPHALILGKPLVNLGNVALNERIKRPGGFPTALDVLLKSYGDISIESANELNLRFWNKFDAADWSKTKFIISYMYEDDYDPDGYTDLISHLKTEGVQVYGKGIHGRHNDNTYEVMQWFKSQYLSVLEEEFGKRF